jgi:hypothetical protein
VAMRSRWAARAGILTAVPVALALLSGCGGDKWVKGRPPVYRASGQVLYQGKPLEGAFVTFTPTGGGTHGASGRTDAEGRFTLTTFEPGDGAPAGRYRVTVTKAKAVVTPDPVDPIANPPLKVEQRHLIPAKYSSPEKSGLESEITASGKNEYRFELAG